MLAGKGMWFWEIDKTEADTARLVALAQAAGLQHVLVKITDGEFNFPIPSKDADGSKERLTHDTIVAFQAAGITVWGWGFVYGSGVDIEMQAHRMAARVRQFDLGGVVVNAEDFGRRKWSSQGGSSRATRFMETLKDDLSGLEQMPLFALSSYRYMSAHGSFPFDAFMAHCDIAMPQVYWVARGAGDALRNLQDSYQEYHAAFPNKLFIPTGAAYGEYYGSGSSRYYWSATPEQITIFLNQARALGIPAVNFWSWQHARGDAANLWFSGTQLWDTIANYAYDVSAAPPDDDESAVVETDGGSEVHIGDPGHHDGVYAGMPNASYNEFVRGGRRMKYALSSASRSGVWAAWVPSLSESGEYAIDVWIPGVHATSQRARYFIHGVVGQPSAVQVELNQQRFYDAWVPLGIYPLEASQPQSGMVNLNNLTGEFEKEIAFAGIRWRPVSSMNDSDRIGRGETGAQVADGFDSPVGTLAERRGGQIWPGGWFDATGYATRYSDSTGRSAYHTGADLNLNQPHWNVDAGMPVYSIASGLVTFAGSLNVWGGIVVIRHDPLVAGGSYVYSRLAHLATIGVREGQRVARGDQVGTIGKPTGGTEHLHFDISPTEALFTKPGDWPRLDFARLQRDYIDPRTFIQQNRPR
jgi:murein DD-endopeptidase MepM/ murein hydrolase activator NlpD